ncbi:MAG: hypothetical protein AAI946_00255 [Candidatus Hodgkinia cicadicola]
MLTYSLCIDSEFKPIWNKLTIKPVVANTVANISMLLMQVQYIKAIRFSNLLQHSSISCAEISNSVNITWGLRLLLLPLLRSMSISIIIAVLYSAAVISLLGFKYFGGHLPPVRLYNTLCDRLLLTR